MAETAARLFVAAFLSALLLGLVFTWLARRLALRLHVVAVPSEERWHRAPTPLLGGLAIVLAFILAGFVLKLFTSPAMQRLTLVSLGMFCWGLIDDLRQLRPNTKLLGQLALCGVLLFLGFRLSLTGSSALDIPLTLLWLVGITNAFNLLDNMNGLCGGIALLVALFRAALFAFEGEPRGALLCLIFVGATAGFLYFNFPMGRIFLGDGGSHFLGFWLAGITLTGAHPYTKSYAALLAFPVLIMLVPIFDTTLVTITRRLSGRPVSIGGRDHLSHRLVAYGLADQQAVLVLWGISFLSGSLALLAAMYGVGRFISIGAVSLLSLILFGIYMGRFEEKLPPTRLAEARVRRELASRRLGLVLTALFDIALIVLSYHAAFLLRFEGILTSGNERMFLSTLLEVVLIKLGVFVLLGVYQASWKYSSLEDALALGWTSVVASVTVVLYLFLVYRLWGFSRVVFVVDFILFTLLFIAFRFSFRILDRIAPQPLTGVKRVVIYPADDDGEIVLRLILNKRQFAPVGFLDDDAHKIRDRIRGIPILGGFSDLGRLVEKHHIEAVVLASEDPSRNLTVAEICQQQGLALFRAELNIEEIRPLTVSGRA